MSPLETLTLVLIFAVVPVVTAVLAHRKGYHFLIWFFAAGILGLIVLAFLPFANSRGLPPRRRLRLTRNGNSVGLVLIAVSLLLGVMRLLAAWAGPQSP